MTVLAGRKTDLAAYVGDPTKGWQASDHNGNLDHAAGWVNAKEYCACDGTTDDYAALGTLLSVVGSGRIVLVIPAPTKVGTNLTIPSTVRVRFENGYFTGAGVVAFRPALGHVTPEDFGAIGDGATDDTTALQRCLDAAAATAGGGRVRFRDAIYVTLPLFVGSNTTLDMSSGTTLLAKAGSGGTPAYARLDCLLNLQQVSNVVIRGNGGTIKMQRAEYVAYEGTQHSEWRHCITMSGSSNVTISDINLKDSGGDGIYIGMEGAGHTGTSTYCTNISINSAHSDNMWRTGMSLVSADGVKVFGGLFENTNGNPAGTCYGIDIEPNAADANGAMRGIRLIGVKTKGNSGGGIQVVPDALNSTSGVLDVVIDGHTSDTDGAALTGGGEAFGMRVSATTTGAWANSVPGQIVYKNFTIIDPYAAGIGLEDLVAASSPRVSIQDGSIFNVNQGGSVTPDFMAGLWIGSGASGSTVNGNFEVRRLRVYDSRGTPATYAAAYIKDATPTFTNYLLEDVWGYGFTPTARMIVKLGTSTNMSITYTQPLLNELTFSGTIGALHDFIGQRVAVTASGVAPLPAAATVIGQVWPFRMVNTCTFQIRPVNGETILQYGGTAANSGHTLGDLTLNYAGDYAELQAVAASTWQVTFATSSVNRPQGATTRPPAQRRWYAKLADITTDPRTDWTVGEQARIFSPVVGAPWGYDRLTTGSANVLDTDWRALGTVPIKGSGTLGTSAITAGTTATQNITVTGAAAGAVVEVGAPSTLEAGLVLFAYVSATNTVTLRVANVTTGSITPAASQTVKVLVFNP